MEFVCNRCQKRFSTSYQPVIGREYRIPCKCGNTIVLRFDQPQRMGPPPLPPRAAPRSRGQAESARTATPAAGTIPAPPPRRGPRRARRFFR